MILNIYYTVQMIQNYDDIAVFEESQENEEKNCQG